MPNEFWKQIDGYIGYYEVSDLGHVRSLGRVVIDTLGRRQTRNGRLLNLMGESIWSLGSWLVEIFKTNV